MSIDNCWCAGREPDVNIDNCWCAECEPDVNIDNCWCAGREPDVNVDIKPKFSAPVWLEEIHNNKIFNKRRNLIMEEETEPASLDSDTPRENSKTESDQDSHTSV